MSRPKLERCFWAQFETDKILLPWDLLTPNMGGISQPKQESWPLEGKRRNCLRSSADHMNMRLHSILIDF